MNQYQTFRFKRYNFDSQSKLLSLYYGYDDALEFCETYHFDFPFIDYDQASFDRACQLLFFMAGVSYYKMYLAPEIIVEAGQIDSQLANFLSDTYQHGLGEFFVINKLDPRTVITFPTNITQLAPTESPDLSGLLIGLGGGKDSLVSVDLLGDQPKVATWTLNHAEQLAPLVEKIGLPHYQVGRTWDPQIKDLNAAGALNGHVPISAIFGCGGAIVCILTGFRDTVVSNESSASEPTLHANGLAINHQYSKSLAYEQAYQATLRNLFGDRVRYYSLLRPFSELYIAQLFAERSFETYKNVFSSCNQAFTHDQHAMFWCGECAKCAFAFLILTPFIERSELEQLWNGKNLLLDPQLEPMYRRLLGIEGDKPFDCVGEIKESRAAMRLAQKTYPEITKYEFDIPEDYNYRDWQPHSMPGDSFDVLVHKLT